VPFAGLIGRERGRQFETFFFRIRCFWEEFDAFGKRVRGSTLITRHKEWPVTQMHPEIHGWTGHTPQKREERRGEKRGEQITRSSACINVAVIPQHQA